MNTNAIEIILADGTEDVIIANSKKEARDFLHEYRNRKSAAVRINPGGALVELFDAAGGKSAIRQAMAYIEYLDFGSEED